MKDGGISQNTIDYLCNIFPELAESKDDRIRKTLIAFHKSTIDIDGIKGGEIIEWLEKQGKQPIWTDNDRTMAFTLLRDIDQMTYISNEGKNERLEWLNSLEDKFNKE
jgi:hypothetical protein